MVATGIGYRYSQRLELPSVPAGIADSSSKGSPWRSEIVLDVVIHPSSDPPESGVVRDGVYMEQLQDQDVADYKKRK
jgi:hypothetical protein